MWCCRPSPAAPLLQIFGLSSWCRRTARSAGVAPADWADCYDDCCGSAWTTPCLYCALYSWRIQTVVQPLQHFIACEVAPPILSPLSDSVQHFDSAQTVFPQTRHMAGADNSWEWFLWQRWSSELSTTVRKSAGSWIRRGIDVSRGKTSFSVDRPNFSLTWSMWLIHFWACGSRLKQHIQHLTQTNNSPGPISIEKRGQRRLKW